MIKHWKVNSNTQIGSYKIFNVNEEISVSPLTNKEHKFYTIDSKDWVNIVAITSDKKIILVRQYRHGIHNVTLEIPAGASEEGESYVATALRELQEETGYEAESINCKYLGFIHPNPALFNNKCHTVLIENVKCSPVRKLDETEDIEVIEWNISDIPKMILDGIITSPFTLSAILLFLAKTEQLTVNASQV